MLAEGGFYRVGGSQLLRVDVRIVAATHQPLEQRVEQGLFREDLFHRLNVIRLRLPPLRERTEDIAGLARHFLALSARTLGVPAKRLTKDAMEALARFDFPGNVRQLENFCHWMTVMSAGQVIDRDDLPPELRQSVAQVAAPGQGGDWQRALQREAQQRLAAGEPALMASLTRQFETILLESALQATRGRRVEAAARLGIGRNTITRKLRELGLSDEPESEPS